MGGAHLPVPLFPVRENKDLRSKPTWNPAIWGSNSVLTPISCRLCVLSRALKPHACNLGQVIQRPKALV